MKNFAPLQITALAVLSVIVIALAIAAFATGNSLATETVEVAAAHTTPQIIEIRLADNTNMPTPVPIPAPTPTPEATEAPTSTPTRAPKNEGDGIFTLEIKDNTIVFAILRCPMSRYRMMSFTSGKVTISLLLHSLSAG